MNLDYPFSFFKNFLCCVATHGDIINVSCCRITMKYTFHFIASLNQILKPQQILYFWMSTSFNIDFIQALSQHDFFASVSILFLPKLNKTIFPYLDWEELTKNRNKNKPVQGLDWYNSLKLKILQTYMVSRSKNAVIHKVHNKDWTDTGRWICNKWYACLRNRNNDSANSMALEQHINCLEFSLHLRIKGGSGGQV